MAYHIQGDMDEAFFKENADQVVEKLDALEDIPFDIVVIEDTQQCDAIFDLFDIQDKEAFLQNCEDALTSISYRAEGQEIIVIKADKQFIQENDAALRGLIAHELMHVVHRKSGVELEIQEAAKEHADDAVVNLRDLGLTDEEISAFIGTVFATAIFCLKDIYDNTDLIQQSFTADLEEYYYNMLGIEDYCRVPDFYGEEVQLDEIENALAFELGLLPAWLPFKALNRDASDKIRQRIKECYERDIPDVAAHIQPLTELYEDKYDQPDEFKHAFFEHILESSYRLIEQKRGQPA